MHLFYYLYMDAGLTPSLIIKVMKLKAFLQLQKSEIQSPFPIDSLSSIETLNLLGTDTIITGTGTTGDTTILTSGTNTITGITMNTGINIGFIIIGILFLIARVLDRRLNQNLDLGQGLDQMNQDQEYQTDQE